MRTHKWTIIIAGIVGAAVLPCALIINNLFGITFWVGVLQGVFCSAVLVFAVEIISYITSRKEAMEDFISRVHSVLRKLNTYDHNVSIDKKIEYYLQIIDFDYNLWDELGMAYARIDFVFNCVKTKKYIYDSIYKPLEEIKSQMEEHYWAFRWYIDSPGHSDGVIEVYVSIIEPMMLRSKTWDEDGTKCTDTENRIVSDTIKELHGRFFDIMYGKKRANTLREEKKKIQRD